MANPAFQTRPWPWIARFAEANAALIAAANLGKVNASGSLVRTRPGRVPIWRNEYQCVRNGRRRQLTIECHRPPHCALECDNSVQEPLASLTQFIGRRWIRTSDFHRVRMARKAKNPGN